MPFVKNLRDRDLKCVNDPIYDAISDRGHAVLKLDSGMPFLTLLKRDGTANQLTKERANVGKVGGRLTECGSACDRTSLFCNTKHNQKRETAKQTHASLREVTTKAMDALKAENY